MAEQQFHNHSQKERSVWAYHSLFVSCVLLIGLVVPSRAYGSTSWYVRSDGGSAAQCTGRVNAAYAGSGLNQPCAWSHPFYALPPGGPARISGGDTLVIATGSYQMGYGAPDPQGVCSHFYPWDCLMSPVPSGPSPAQPTRILGEGWDTGCLAPPALWGTQRVATVLNLTNSSNVEVSCLEITDHAGCAELYSGDTALNCQRDTFPFGDWASVGIRAADSSHVVLRDLNIHGLAHTGILAGRLTDWTVENVRIAGNAWVGWDGDIDNADTNAGLLLFRKFTVEWNGCIETWPDGQPTGCWSQTAGGYGDGLGTGATGGHWIFEDCIFRFNTSDGLDLLYLRNNSTVEIRRTLAQDNAGNQIKTSGPAVIENSVIVGNCDFFVGKPFTYAVDPCRALGNALSIDLRRGTTVEVLNATLTSQGDCLVVVGCEDGSCDGTEEMGVKNTIVLGATDYWQPWELSCLAYVDPALSLSLQFDHSIISHVKHDECPGGTNLCGVEPGYPGVVNPDPDVFDAHLLPTSPAIDAANAVTATADDYTGQLRDSQPDIGAYEFGCDDGLFCTVSDQHTNGTCGGSPRNCDNGQFCDGTESCNETTDSCNHSGNPCPNDSLFCNGTESCNETTNACQSSGNPCPGGQTCNESGDQCVASGPDLVVRALSNPPATAVRRSKFSLTSTTLNQGAASAKASKTRYFLSLDTVKSSGDKALTGVHSVAALTPGVSATKTVTVTVPANTVLNSYFVLACADDTKVVVESNEGNNCTASATTVTVGP